MGEEFYQTVEDKFIFRVKKDLRYTEDDVWVRVEGKSARIGVTDFFQRRGGDIVYRCLRRGDLDPQVSRTGHLFYRTEISISAFSINATETGSGHTWRRHFLVNNAITGLIDILVVMAVEVSADPGVDK